jgi:anti-sigma regulatory factor (Ser/Thr protein kinase)
MTSAPAPAVTTPEAAPGPAPLPARTHRQRGGPVIRDRSLVLGAIDTAPRTARAALRACLTGWKLGHLQDDAELILDELVGNAVTASRQATPEGEAPAAITVKIAVEDDELRLQAWDPDPIPPPIDYTPGTWDESGRGLMIVKALAYQWGTTPGTNGGKHVFAALRAATPDEADPATTEDPGARRAAALAASGITVEFQPGPTATATRTSPGSRAPATYGPAPATEVLDYAEEIHARHAGLIQWLNHDPEGTARHLCDAQIEDLLPHVTDNNARRVLQAIVRDHAGRREHQLARPQPDTGPLMITGTEATATGTGPRP